MNRLPLSPLTDQAVLHLALEADRIATRECMPWADVQTPTFKRALRAQTDALDSIAIRGGYAESFGWAPVMHGTHELAAWSDPKAVES